MGSLSRGLWIAAAVMVFARTARSQAPVRGSLDIDAVDTSTGQGIAGARVRLQFGTDEPRFVVADPQGHLRVTGLDFGHYGIDVRAPGFISSRAPGTESGHEAVSLARNAPNGQVRVEMERGSAIIGKVTDAVGVPLEGVSVSAFQRVAGEERRNAAINEGGYQYLMVRGGVTNDLGEYRMAPLAAGSYFVMARPGSNYFPSQPAMRPPPDNTERATFYPHAVKISDAKAIELAAGKETMADVSIIRQGGVTVSGRILSAVSAPGLLEWVNLRPLSFGLPNVSTSITGDRFTAWNVLPGKYNLEAGQGGGNDVTAARRTIDVGTEDIQGFDVELQRTPELEVAVAFQSGCPPAPAVIQLQSDSQRVRTLHVDADGIFVFEHVWPDKYRIYSQPEGPARVFVVSGKLGDADGLTSGFDVTAETKGPLRITMGCAGR